MTTPADQEQRDHILNDLDSNIVVEAAAGTGKTTSMVGRMVALLLEDKCKISTIAAVTFTKKSASELRERFHAAPPAAGRLLFRQLFQFFGLGSGSSRVHRSSRDFFLDGLHFLGHLLGRWNRAEDVVC